MSGKRGPTLALSGSSDEENSDHDEVSPDACPTSPCSSTSSGPTYVRTAGFKHHGHTFTFQRTKQPKHKKKKQSFTTDCLVSTRKKDPLVLLGGLPKPKPKKDPLPMKLRALPQSFWQQPNAINTASPATMYPVLPPLYKQDAGEDVLDVRPVTPPDERKEEEKDEKEKEREKEKEKEKEKEREKDKDKEKEKEKEKESKDSKPVKRPQIQPRPPARIITASSAETDLLVTLFDGIENDKKKIIKRGRPKRVQVTESKGPLQGDDPYMLDNIAEGLLPMLSLENCKHSTVATHQLSMVSVKEGDKSITLPSLSVEQNYSHMLSELVKAL